MPPRRSARLVELANPHFQLPFPPNVVALLFSLLPLDARLRAREVCRGWLFFLKDVCFWTHVDLSASCGVNPRFLSDSRLALALLRTACVRAQGSLQSVDLSGVEHRVQDEWEDEPVPLVLQWLDSASAANKASLRDLVAPHMRLIVDHVTALCRALPLCRVRCGLECYTVEALPLLRREPPFALLTINALVAVEHNDEGAQPVLDLASALMGYFGMEKLIMCAPLTTLAVLDALVDAAISAGIKDAAFQTCGLSQASLPALGRLIQSPGFERLEVIEGLSALFEGPALPAFCEALRNSTTLKKLKLMGVNLWEDMASASELIAALEGLPALHELELLANFEVGPSTVQRAAGECLARLIARSTSLRALCLGDNHLDEDGMTPIFQALSGSLTLVELILYGSMAVNQNFARDVVLPAVRTNTSLRELDGLRWLDAQGIEWGMKEEDPPPAMEEVEDILKARVLADEEAA